MAKPRTPVTLDEHYSVNVSKHDKDLIDEASRMEDEPKPSRWLRKVGLKAAREVLQKKGRLP
jgi:hypothetical protein